MSGYRQVLTHNPYLHEYADVDAYDFEARKILCHKYAFAIPNDAALTVIASHTPILEIGAGSGYWASLLSNIGADVVAYDDKSWFHKFDSWYPVHRGGPEVICRYPSHTLFLCWPPYENSMAYDCLQHYTGKTLLAITEGSGGCCGDDDFWCEIDQHWKMIQNITIPRYKSIHDCLEVFTRK